MQNPYRILGVYANSAKKDIVANKGKAIAFLKVNRPVEYPLDLKGIMPSPTRTLDSMNEAESHLAIDKEQIKYAQFWFIKITPIDDIAFNHLLAGNMDGALEMWSKQESMSSLQNRLVCYLIKNNYQQTLKTAEKLYAKFGDNYISKIDANCSLKMTTTELLHQFVSTLSEENGMLDLLNYELGKEIKTYIINQAVGPLIARISAEIENTKRVDHNNPQARIEAAQELVYTTGESFKQLKELLPSDNPQFAMIADKLGLEILQCGIDYFHNSEDDDAPRKAMWMLKYARSVVVGPVAKQRCEENIKILQKIIDELPPKEVMAEYRAIKEELDKFQRLPDKISYAITLLNNSKPYLQEIKQKLGIGNKTYLDLSTVVVNNALHNVIEEVNAVQKKSSANSLVSCLTEAWQAIVIMDSFDIDASTKKSRYLPNRKTLKDLCDRHLPPNGTEPYMQSIDYEIRKFNDNFGTSLFEGLSSPYLNILGFFDKVTNDVEKVLSLLRNTKQPLNCIRENTSPSNSFYLDQSTHVASIAFSKIIEVVNDSQKDHILIMSLQSNPEFKSIMKKCYEACGLIDEMDVSSEFARHYRANRETLRKMCVNLGIINDFSRGSEGCMVTLFAIMGTLATSIYCLVSIFFK